MGVYQRMMTKKELKVFADDLQAKYFQGIKEKTFETESETYAQIEIVEWILNAKSHNSFLTPFLGVFSGSYRKVKVTTVLCVLGSIVLFISIPLMGQ